MNKDIVLVEEALKNEAEAQAKHNEQMRIDYILKIEGYLRNVLKNVPCAEYRHTDNTCEAYVDGMRFYYYNGEFSDCVACDHKILRKFLKWSRVCKRTHLFIHCQPGLEWVLAKHLEALKWEEAKNVWI